MLRAAKLMPRPGASTALALVAAFGVLGCNAGVPPGSPQPSASEAAVASGSIASIAPTIEPSLAPPTEEEQRAIDFRIENSLPADLAHIRAVAADPSADTSFGVPLLPAEFMELMNRGNAAQEILPIVQAEAAKAPQDFCGLWIDNANEGALTSAWRANLAIHEAVIRAQLPPGARVAFEPCTYALADLRALQDRITRDHDWFRSIQIALRGVGADESENVLRIEVSTTVPNVAAIIAERYGVPVGMLAVESDGTGAAFVRGGVVRIFVVGPDGKPIGPNDLGFDWEPLDLAGLSCGVGDMGFGVSWDEKPSELPCQAGRWRISVRGAGILYGQGTVTVIADEAVDLRIKLTKDPPPAQ